MLFIESVSQINESNPNCRSDQLFYAAHQERATRVRKDHILMKRNSFVMI